MPYIPFGQQTLNYAPTPQRFDEIFDELRRGWRRLKREKLLRILISRLHQKQHVDAIAYTLDARARGHMDFVPRTLLLWVLADTHAYRGQSREPDDKSVHRLLNLTWRLSAAQEALQPFPSNPFLALRNIAVQQFSSQELLLEPTVGRNWIIFGALAANHRVRELLEATTGLPLEDAISFVLLLSSACVQSEGTPLRTTIFQYARNVFNANTKLRDTLVAHDGRSLRGVVRVDFKQEDIFAPTPFIRYPLIRLGEEVCIVDPICAAKTAEHYPAQIVAEFGDQHHKKALTELYEAYINKRVAEVFPHDSTVGEKLRGMIDGRVCDQFVRLSPDCVLLVEIKSGALADHKSVSLSGERLFNMLDGILKEGVEQLVETRRCLRAIQAIRTCDRVILLLVTRENLRLPHGDMLSDMMPKLDLSLSQYEGSENFFVCCIDEFDELLDIHAAGDLPLSQFFSIDSAIGDDAARSKNGVGGRLRTAKRVHVARHLRAAYDAATNHCGLLLNRMKATHDLANR